MIKQVTGDILLSTAQALAHGIAPNDHFDSGLALSLRTDWPALHKDFRHYLHTAHPKVGGLWVWTKTDGRRVVNLFTQEPSPNEHARPGKASYQNLNHCLRELHKLIDIAIPKNRKRTRRPARLFLRPSRRRGLEVDLDGVLGGLVTRL